MGGIFSWVLRPFTMKRNPAIVLIEKQTNERPDEEKTAEPTESSDPELEVIQARSAEERTVPDASGRQEEVEMANATQATTSEINAVSAETLQESSEERADTGRPIANLEADNAKEAEQSAERVEPERGRAQKMAMEADERAQRAEVEQREAERKWMQGIQPVVWPTPEELEFTKKMRQYTEGLFHFAIAGIAGCGKSSLINAFRGLKKGDEGYCSTGIVETTKEIGRYPDPDSRKPFVWYDIPGAGTLSIPDWKYFNDQGLYIFDCVIIVFDNRFTAIDIAILRNCQLFNIPSYVIRSKSEQHIRNHMEEMSDYDSDGGYGYNNKLWSTAREEYMKETYQNVQQNLEAAGLDSRPVYLVSRDVLLAIVTGATLGSKLKKAILDEYRLLQDMDLDSRTRRSVKRVYTSVMRYVPRSFTM